MLCAVGLAKVTYASLVALLEEEHRGTEAVDIERYKALFRTPLHEYDALIHLNTKHLTRRFQHVDFEPEVCLFTLAATYCFAHFDWSRSRQVVDRKKTFRNVELNAARASAAVKVEFDCAARYVQDLQKHFGDVATFFYDATGGDVIGVVWTQQVFVVHIPFPHSL